MAITDRPSWLRTYCTALWSTSTPFSVAFSCRSSAIATACGVAPAARIAAIDSRTAVPADITSSTISTRPLQRRADQGAALAVVLGFLAVVGEGHVAAAPRQLDRHRGAPA